MSAYSADSFFAEHWKYLLAALVLHAAIIVLMTVSFHSSQRYVAPAQLAIKATVIDDRAARLRRERAEAEQRAREQAQAQAEQKAREQAQAEKAQAEKAQAEKAEAEKAQAEKEAEQQRQAQAAADAKRAEQQRQAEAAQRERQRIAAEQKAAAEKKRVAEIKAKQAAKEKAAREARDQAQREAELKRQLAEEEGLMQAKKSGLLNQYVAMIAQRVERNWNKPSTARPGIQCSVKVTQAPGGTVLSVAIDQCNGDAAVRQSIQAAVSRSSPLPPPPDALLFQRVLLFQFKPDE